MHRRAPSLVAKYTGDQVRCPRMRGGKFDTLGFRSLPHLPDLPGAPEHQSHLEAELGKLPDDATSEDRRDVMSASYNGAPHEADYASLFERPEYKEITAERNRISKQNARKRKRSAALDGGATVDFRADTVAGDPAI